MNIEKKQSLKDFSFIMLGCLINSLGVNLFLVNARLLTGGVAGIALTLQYLTAIPVGYSSFILNIPLLLLSYFKLSKKFTLYTLVGTFGCSLTLVLTEFTTAYVNISDPFLITIFGGVLEGIGIGIVFAYNGSTGGLDILAALIKKHKEYANIGSITFLLNGIIVTIGAFLFGLEIALYTLVMMFISSLVIDKIIHSLNKKKLLLVVTSKEKEISERIMTNIERGVTFLYGEGAFTKERFNIIYTVVSTKELQKAKDIIRKEDANAFISVLDVNDVEGLGFKKDLPL